MTRNQTRNQYSRPVLAGLVAILIGLGAGSTLALLSINAATRVGTVTAGDLWVSIQEMTWEHVTPGVTDGASGVLATSPADFWSMPGDVIEIRVPVTTFVQGDNLVADLIIDCGAAASSEASVSAISASFHIEDASGVQVAPAAGSTPIEEPLTVHGLLGGNSGTTAQWTVVIRVDVLGDYQWVTPQSPDALIGWSVGAVRADVKQIRPGGGAG